MASMQQIHDIVMAYPAASQFGFTDPDDDTDSISPAFSTLDFAGVYNEFTSYLQRKGVNSNVPFASMQRLTVWLDLVTLVFGSQSA